MPHGIPKREQALWALTGALAGAAVFLLFYGTVSLNVTDDSWIRTGFVEKDILQHYAGWQFFRSGGWSWPLGASSAMDGTSVLFTDSIPAAALLFKLLSPLLPQTFQYFGLWVLGSYMAQGTAAALLLRLFTENRAGILAGTLVFCASPVLAERAFRHTSLASQWLILFALYLYFRDRRTDSCGAGWLVLSALAAAIHAYFIPMLYALLLACLLENVLRTRRPGKAALYLAANFAVTFGVLYLLGAFTTGFADGSTNYGYFQLNLNALVQPASRGGLVWSQVLPARPAEMGSLEGFNYPGLGVLAVLPFAAGRLLLRPKKELLPMLGRHWALALACLCLTAFAVSNVVLLDGRVLMQFGLPQKLMQLCGVLRSSGRMFWPVYYLLMLAALRFLLSVLPAVPKKGARVLPAVLVCVLLAVQLWDIRPAVQTRRQLFDDGVTAGLEYADPMRDSFWDFAAANYTRLAALDGLEDNLFVAGWAARSGLATDEIFAARYDAAVKSAEFEKSLDELLNGQPREDTLYITSSRELFQQAAEAVGKTAVCARVDEKWYVIAPGRAAQNLTTRGAFVLLDDLPLVILSYSDANWDCGVMTRDNRTIAFADDAYTRTKLDGAVALECGGRRYEIAGRTDKDDWIMLEMEVQDAHIFCGAELQPLYE